MSDCQPYIEIHTVAGSTQSNRLLDALKTDFVKIDEREIKDLIIATHKLSGNLNFYSGENVILGNWNSFFEWESTSVFAQIASLQIEKYSTDYKLKRRKLLFIPLIDDQKKEIEPFFKGIESSIKELRQKINHLPDELKIKEYFIAAYPEIERLINTIITEINKIDKSVDLLFSLQNHLFNKKIQNLFGLLSDWKDRSSKQLYNNIASYPKHSPQYALYLTFLKLFENAQQDLNTFTKKHLDFYYKNILHLKPRLAVPDYVHCCIEPHKNEAPFSIKKDSIFLAGKNTEGKNRYYVATADSTINQAKIESLYSGFKRKNIYHFEELTDKNASGESWSAFSENTIAEQMGLLIASPLLFLRGGDRLIELTFKDSNNNSIKLNAHNYNFYLSGEKEWQQITDIPKDGNTLQLSIPASEKAIVPLNAEIHEGAEIDTPFPVLKILVKDGKLKNIAFSTLDIEVTVSNYKQFNLYSNTGLIDHTKPFQPFGIVPKTGLEMVFSCNEFFQKKNAKGNFHFVTDNEPGFRRARQGINPKTGERVEIKRREYGWNIQKRTKLSYLNNGVWSTETDWNKKNKYKITNASFIPYTFLENEPLTTDVTSGFSKIILTDTNYIGESYLEDYIKESKKDNPDLPYIPTINSIAFSYYVKSQENQVDYFNIYPKGYEKLKNDSGFELIPTIQNEGELFIGIKDIQSGNSLSLLFQVAEGSANPRQLPIELTWSYLEKDQWKEFKPEHIGDETNGLTQSGIVQFQAPELLLLQHHHILPADLWWIRINVSERFDAICHLVGIHTQALKASLFDFENSGLSFTENIEANTISKLYKPKNQIKKIEQPYVSFNGKIKQTDMLFYQQASERMRHKDKSITAWDYEKLILEKFPEVFRVKCLNHYRYDEDEINNSSSGYITIIPVAKSFERNVPEYWKPIVAIGTMKRIKAFLKLKSSPHVRLNVKPPKLEKLELVFNVKYKELPGADSRLFTQQLNEIINTYLSPWAYKANDAISFQTELEKSKLIQLIEQRSYVDYITDFKVNHLILAENSDRIVSRMNDIEKIKPKTVYSLFVPHNHSIIPITKTCCI